MTGRDTTGKIIWSTIPSDKNRDKGRSQSAPVCQARNLDPSSQEAGSRLGGKHSERLRDGAKDTQPGAGVRLGGLNWLLRAQQDGDPAPPAAPARL